MKLIKGTVTSINFEIICKICLEEKSPTVPVNSIMEFQEDISSATVFDILVKVANVEQGEGYLDTFIICHDCLHDLKIAYLFLLKYQESRQQLNSFLSTFVKEEEIVIEAVDDQSDGDHCYETRMVVKKRLNKSRKRGRKKDNDRTTVTPSRVLHPCPICTKEFTALDLRDHAHTHKALKKYLNIPQSFKATPTTKFTSRRHLDEPHASLFTLSKKLHKCPYCNEQYSVEKFRLHIEAHRKHSEFKCDKCQRVFRKLNHLNTHRVKHLKEFPHKCEQCGKGFVIKNNFDCHMLTHTNDELPHECRFCLKRFSNPEHLNRHQIIHTENVTYSVKYRVCRCHHCLKTFKDKSELQLHICTPVEQITNTKFPCKICDKVFKHASSLYNHKRNIHKLKGAKILCSVCGNYVSNIYNHMMRHTGEKPYPCNQCEKRFIAKPQLKQHLLVHSGLKPYVCSVCGKAFNNLYNLQVHERIHKGDRCHICSICEKGFLEKSYLKKHMNVHKKLE